MSLVTTLFIVFSGLAFVLILIPRPWHFRSWNIGALAFRFWVGVGTLNLFINAIVWRNDAIKRAPIWCDISTRLYLATGFSLPLISLCLNRRLYFIMSGKHASLSQSKRESLRAIAFDIFLTFALPVLLLPLCYVVQGHRFNIFEEIGCVPYIYPSVLTYVLVNAPQLLAGVISAIYAGANILALMRQRRKAHTLFAGGVSGMDPHVYLRLMAFAGLDVVVNTPMSIVAIAFNLKYVPVRPYVSWSDVHWGFSRIDCFPSIIWRNIKVQGVFLEMTRWTTVFCAVVFFIFYGLSKECYALYLTDLRLITARMCSSTGQDPLNEEKEVGVFPKFVVNATAETGTSSWISTKQEVSFPESPASGKPNELLTLDETN